MMHQKRWFTSDTHFGHANILTYCPIRPWSSVPDMEDGIVSNWNSHVNPGDIVYHLGDFAMGDRTQIPRILSRLNGHIVLVAGNHDHKNSLPYFKEVHSRLEIDICGKLIELIHNPGQAKFNCEGVLCGHVHYKWKTKRKDDVIPSDDVQDHQFKHPEMVAMKDVYNVGVDVNNFEPVSEIAISEFFEKGG